MVRLLRWVPGLVGDWFPAAVLLVAVDRLLGCQWAAACVVTRTALCALYSVRLGLGVSVLDSRSLLRLVFGVSWPSRLAGGVGQGPVFRVVVFLNVLGMGDVVPH